MIDFTSFKFSSSIIVLFNILLLSLNIFNVNSIRSVLLIILRVCSIRMLNISNLFRMVNILLNLLKNSFFISNCIKWDIAFSLTIVMMRIDFFLHDNVMSFHFKLLKILLIVLHLILVKSWMRKSLVFKLFIILWIIMMQNWIL